MAKDEDLESRVKALEDHDQFKAALKEGIREWLDEKFATFGKWTMSGLAAAGLAGLIYFILTANGWHKS